MDGAILRLQALYNVSTISFIQYALELGQKRKVSISSSCVASAAAFCWGAVEGGSAVSVTVGWTTALSRGEDVEVVSVLKERRMRSDIS